VVHDKTALNSSENLPSYPPDNHQKAQDVYWRGGYSVIFIVVLTEAIIAWHSQG